MTDFLDHFFGFEAPTELGSTHLFARSGFWGGASRILDVFGTSNIYNWSAGPAEADYRALFSDWYIVGRDFRRAAEELDLTAK